VSTSESGPARVCMLVYNNFTTDARVLKEARTLSALGHAVEVIAVLDKTTVPEMMHGEIRVHRIDRRPLHYRLLWRTRRTRRSLRLAAGRVRRRRGRLVRLARSRLRRARMRASTRLRRARMWALARLPLRAPLPAALCRLRAVRKRSPAMRSDVVAIHVRPPSLMETERVARLVAHPLVVVGVRVYAAIRWRINRRFPALHRINRRLWGASLTTVGVWPARRRARQALVRERYGRGALIPDLAGSVVSYEGRRDASPPAVPAPVAPEPASDPAPAVTELALTPSQPDPVVAEADQEAVVVADPAAVLAPAAASAPAPSSLFARIDQRVSRWLHRRLMSVHKPLMFMDWYVRAYRHVRASGADVIHAHDLNTLPAAVALSRALRVPLVYDAHELYPEISTLSRREQRIWRFIEARLIGRATAVFTVCESIADEMSSRYRIDKPAVLLNCPPAVASAARRPADGLRRAAGVEPGVPLILYQGGFSPNRGLPELIRASRALERGALVLMGWGTLEGELRLLVDELELRDAVRFIAPVPQDELLGWTRQADIGVIPYRPVGLNNVYSTPNKLFEYMAAGLAIAGSRLPELSRFIDGLQIGITFEAGNPADMALALNFLLADEHALAAMRAESLDAAKTYCWERQSVSLERLYERLTGGPLAGTAVPARRA
jgi:glycosyltransferase involved in cell wall biosynthesis